MSDAALPDAAPPAPYVPFALSHVVGLRVAAGWPGGEVPDVEGYVYLPLAEALGLLADALRTGAPLPVGETLRLFPGAGLACEAEAAAAAHRAQPPAGRPFRQHPQILFPAALAALGFADTSDQHELVASAQLDLTPRSGAEREAPRALVAWVAEAERDAREVPECDRFRLVLTDAATRSEDGSTVYAGESAEACAAAARAVLVARAALADARL